MAVGAGAVGWRARGRGRYFGSYQAFASLPYSVARAKEKVVFNSRDGSRFKKAIQSRGRYWHVTFRLLVTNYFGAEATCLSC